MIFFLFLSCAEPFLLDAHDLSKPRIAALSAIDGVMIWSGSGRYHTETPELYWRDDMRELLGEGYHFVPPLGVELQLEVVLPNGDQLLSEVTYQEGPELPDLLYSTYESDLSDVTLAARQSASVEPVVDALTDGWTWRIEQQSELLSRWMTPYPSGEILELSAQSTDVLPFQLELDNGVVVHHEASALEGVLLLLLDGEGGNRWRWLDPPRSEAVSLQGRYVTVDEHPPLEEAERWTAVVTAEDSLIGFSLSEWRPYDELEAELPSCFGSAQMLELRWIESGQCPLPMLIGARVELKL